MVKWLYIWGLFLLASCTSKVSEQTYLGFYSNNLSEGDTLICVPITHYFPGFPLGSDAVKAVVDSNGFVEFNLLLSEASHYQVLNIKYSYHVLPYDLYIEPGDSVVMRSGLNDSLYPTLEFSGRGTGKYQPLVDDCTLFPLNFKYFNYLREGDFPDVMDFKFLVDSVQGARMRHVIENYGIDQPVSQGLYATIWSKRAEQLLGHLQRRNANLGLGYDYYYPPDSYLLFLDSLPQVDSLAHYSAFKMLALPLLQNKVRMLHPSRNEEHIEDSSYLLMFKYLESQNPSLMRDVLALSSYRNFSSYLVYPDFTKSLTDFNNKFLVSYVHKPYLDFFLSKVELYTNLSIGKPLPPISLPNIDEQLRSLEDFKDSILFIDFWGTWCGPCIVNIPYVLKLMEKYENQPVKFLFIALEYGDDEVERWKQFVRGAGNKQVPELPKTGFPGAHWVARLQFHNPAIKPYAIGFVPTYMLADQQHNIVISRTFDFELIEQKIDSMLNAMSDTTAVIQ